MVLSSSTTSIQCNKPQQQQQQQQRRRRCRKNRSICHDTLVHVCHFPLLLLVLRSIVTATNSGSTPNYTPNYNSHNQKSNPRRLTPPPPPPPPPSSSSSSLSSSEFGAAHLIQHAEVVRPPPPPPPPPRTIEATVVERGHPPPPKPNPPPRRHDQGESSAEGSAAGLSVSSSRRSSTLPRPYPPPPQHHPIPPAAVSSPPQQSPQHPPPAASRRTRTTTSSSSLLQNVWGTVERGLDGLVRMDETLSGTAQNLPFWAAKKYWSSPSTVRALSQEQAAAAAAGTRRSSGGAGREGWRPRTQRRRPSTTTTTMVPQLSGVPLQPYGQKYQIAKKQKQQQTQRMETSHILRTANGGASSPYPSPPPNQHQQPPSSSSSVAAAASSSSSASELPSRNNNKKDDTIIVGGRDTRSEDDRSPNSSSSYNNQQQKQQQQQQQQYPRSFSSQPSTNGLFVPNLTTADARTENPPPRFVSHSGSNNDKNTNTNTNTNNIHNKIDQQKMHYDPSRPEAPNDHDQHSRQSRIPWATTSSTASSSSASLSSSERYQDDRGGRHRPASSSLIEGVVPNGRRSTDYKYADARYDMPAWKRSLRRLSSPLKKLVPDLGQVFRFRIGRNRRDKYHASLEAWNLTETEDGNSDRRGFFRKLFRRRSRSDRLSSSSSSVPSSFRASSDHRGEDDGAMDGQSPSLIANMLIRCTEGKTASLLRDTDIRASTTIGRYQSVLDVLFIVSIIVGFKLMPGVSEQVLVSSSLPRSWEDIILVALPKVGSIFYELIQGSWSFFAFLYACLFRYVRERILDGKVDRLASSVASSVKEESEYSQLYLRLMAAIPMDRNLPNRLAVISKKQVANVVSKARLDSYVGIVLASLMLMTASTVGPIILSFFSTIAKIVSLQELRHWPLQWQSIFSASSYLVKDLFQTLEGHTHNAVNALLNNPMQFAFHLSMFASLVICSLLPRLKERWAVTPASGSTTLEDGGGGDGGVIIDDELTTSNFESAEEWSRIGTSSASRLSMLSENGSVENALARWRASRVTLFENSKSSLISNEGRTALSLQLQLLAYTIVVGLVTVVPLFVSHFLAGKGISLSSALSTKFTLFQWDSLLDVSFLQVFLFSLAYQALTKVTESVEHTSFVKEFQTDLVNTKEEMDDSNKRQTDFHSMGSVSPSAGILVRDLWAAHTSKRAWAVRGANFQCKNGEILAILGEDGSGKTRLLTTLAEALTFPPKRTNTTNKVRGFIGICGLEASKWDRKMLKRRLGIYLSDVRIIADSASLFSGWTMEEILEPVDGNRPNSDPLQRKLSPAERSSMFLALKITGLHGTLLARLPSKSLTIFTANEEDLRLTSLKPRSVVLSPGEWSKLILARVLAQTIYDNDNALSSNDKIESSLIGSILLLDDPTMMHSEVEEAQLLRDLRLTGAATVITTNKWATGRFVDQICVVKNGSVVEMGSHNELIARGPQQSLYAAKWHAMTVQ